MNSDRNPETILCPQIHPGEKPCARSDPGASLAALIEQRLSRREALKGISALAASAFGAPLFLRPRTAAAADPTSLTFEEIPHALETGLRVAPGYRAQVLLRWGDRLHTDSPAFDVNAQSAEAQERQFGCNNDFIAFMPLPRGSDNSDNGLLCVNHEHTKPWLMWSMGEEEGAYLRLSKEQVDVEMAGHGHTICEVRRTDGRWEVVTGSRYNRRITLSSTNILLSGPAAGHDRLETSADPSGRRVIGTLNNCSGGTTPWHTVLSAEENFDHYFLGDPKKTNEAENYESYGIKPENRYGWGRYHSRFNIEQEPNEPNRFGWVVEIDPYDPASVPVKRTALGRGKHEGATTVINPDGTVSVYLGDDERFAHLYKYVSRGRFTPNDPAANRDLLDDGTLYAARFDADGTVTWLALVHGNGPLTAANGFHSQADVLIETRRAAKLLGATRMDRPEDVETNPITGRTYVILTNNDQREPGEVDAANPRAKNDHGQIIELIPPDSGGGADHAATTCRWEFFLVGGDPGEPKVGARYLAPVSENGWVSCPDNCAFDAKGRIWIATDGQDKIGISNSLYAADTIGSGRGLTRCFLNAPTGAEICGPAFTPDNRTLFVSIQHPGDDDGSTFDNPSTRWPDFTDGMPPRPAVVAVTKGDGGVIGG